MNIKSDYECKSLEDLKRTRECFNLKEVWPGNDGVAYCVKMIDILLEKIEQLEIRVNDDKQNN